MSVVRQLLGYFCQFLLQRGVMSLENVGPRLVSDFIPWCFAKGSSCHIGFLTRFFDWQRANELRAGASPVIPKFHRGTRSKRNPRPFTQDQITTIWQVLEQHGTPLMRAACAIGEECGLRYSEVHNLRITDVDLRGQQILVQLPNKGKRERTVPLFDKTKTYVTAFLKVRPESSSEYLFVKEDGTESESVICA